MKRFLTKHFEIVLYRRFRNMDDEWELYLLPSIKIEKCILMCAAKKFDYYVTISWLILELQIGKRY